MAVGSILVLQIKKTRKAIEELWKLGVDAERARRIVDRRAMSLVILVIQEFQKAKIEKKLREEAEERQKALEAAEAERKEQFARVQSSVQHRRTENMTKKERQKKEAEVRDAELVCPI